MQANPLSPIQRSGPAQPRSSGDGRTSRGRIARPLGAKESVLLAWLCLLSFASSAAYAHAFPEKSSPEVGATLAAAPKGVTIWYDMDLEDVFSKITVKDASGKVVSQDDSQVSKSDPSILHVDLQPIGSGTYTVYWSVVARDGHHTEGRFRFTVE